MKIVGSGRQGLLLRIPRYFDDLGLSRSWRFKSKSSDFWSCVLL